MKRLLTFGTMAALVLLATVVAPAADAGKTATLKGWITDSFCGAKNANSEGTGCIKDCYKNGAKLELIADGKAYQLSNQKLAFENVGQEVVITGTLDKDTIQVETIVAAKKDKV